MLLRAVVAFLVLPGVVGYTLPLLLAPDESPGGPAALVGAVALVMGSTLLLACVREFYRSGKGTLAPWAPPRHLVTSGPYRRTRNPMYLAVLAILCGWSIWFWSRPLLVYALVMAAVFHLGIVFFEEPLLAAAFPDRWETYRDRVPRWLIRWPRSLRS